MKIEIITLFPDIFSGFFNESLLARAQSKKLITLKAHNLRNWTNDKHKTARPTGSFGRVDDRPYGGGAGMILKVEPIFKAIQALSSKRKHRVILLSAKGKTFTQKDAKRLAKYDQLVFICGRYEGVDERVAKHIADEEISIGNYVLFGGEVAAMVIVESVSRLIPGVVAKPESIKFESFSDKDSKLKEYPQYTRPEELFIDGKKRKVPGTLLTGNHEKIRQWREKTKK